MRLLEEYKNDLLNPNCDLVKVYTKYILAGEVWCFKERFWADWLEISYSTTDVKELFLSVGWLSGKYPERLKKALDNCEMVITA